MIARHFTLSRFTPRICYIPALPLSQRNTQQEATIALPVLLDYDPDHDDAIAIALAPTSPELDVKVITSSAGNRTPEKTLRNVLHTLTLPNRADVPVASGTVKPLTRNLIIVGNVHGEGGLDSPILPEPTFAPQNCTTVELMAKTLRKSEEPIIIVSTGPQTNVVSLLNSRPELHGRIARIVIMDGAVGLGDWTPAVEFNIYVDPETAEVVFRSEIPMAMAGLDVTHKAQIRVEDTEHSRAIGNPVLTIVAELPDLFLECHKDEKWDFVGAPLHNPCTITWLLRLELFTTVERWIGMEIQGKYTQGMTVIDYYYLTGNKPDATVMIDIDHQDFVNLLADHLKLYTQSLAG